MNRETYIAASTSVLSFFENLTASDSSLLQVTTEKNNVLHIAVQFNKYEVAKKIICLCRCLVEQTNSEGNIPLHVAARVENPQMVRFLIDHAEDRDVETGVRQLPRMVNLERDTALHIAVKYGNSEVVKELIKEDSKLAMYVNKAGESALFLAVDRQLYGIASHILCAAPKCSYAGRHGMNVLHALVLQTSSCQRIWRTIGTIQEDFVRKVMEKCPFTIKQGDELGWTPLHIAAHMGNKNYVKLLLENGNSPAYIKNNEGLSALHIAAKEGNIDVMRELIKTSPDIYELLDNRGQTALHAAAESGKYNTVRFFLRRPEFEGLINVQDKEGNTPINLATIKRHNRVISLLKEGEGLDLNAKNKEGFTTLDDHILLRKDLDKYGKSWNYYYIKCQLRLKGARPSLMGALLKLGIRKEGDGKEMVGSDFVKEKNQDNLLVGDKGTARPDSVEKWSETHLLVATLIASVSFTAAITVPGGYHNQGVDEGLAVLSKRTSFRVFLIANTYAFGFSITSILVHFFASLWDGDVAFRKRVARRSFACTLYAIIALLVAFISGTFTVVPRYWGIVVAVIPPFLILYTMSVVR